MFEKYVYSAALANILCVVGVCASFYPPDCFTWKNNENGQLVLSCKLSGARSNVNIFDSKKRYMVKCPNENEMIKCKANSNENNETTFTVIIEQNYEGQWFCENKDITLNANISISKEGFLLSTQLGISGEIVGDNLYRLSCSTCWEVQGLSVEFLVNNKSNDSVRLYNNECYHKGGKCVESQCSCSSNSFNWTFDANNKSFIHNFSCKADFADVIRNCGNRHTITLIVDGQDFKTDLPSVIRNRDCKKILIPDKNNTDIPGTRPSQNDNQLNCSCTVYQTAIVVLIVFLAMVLVLFLIAFAVNYYLKFKRVRRENGTNNEMEHLTSPPPQNGNQDPNQMEHLTSPPPQNGNQDPNQMEHLTSPPPQNGNQDPNQMEHLTSPPPQNGNQDPNQMEHLTSPPPQNGNQDPNQMEHLTSPPPQNGNQDPNQMQNISSHPTENGNQDPNQMQNISSLPTENGNQDPNLELEPLNSPTKENGIKESSC